MVSSGCWVPVWLHVDLIDTMSDPSSPGQELQSGEHDHPESTCAHLWRGHGVHCLHLDHPVHWPVSGIRDERTNIPIKNNLTDCGLLIAATIAPIPAKRRRRGCGTRRTMSGRWCTFIEATQKAIKHCNWCYTTSTTTKITRGGGVPAQQDLNPWAGTHTYI